MFTWTIVKRLHLPTFKLKVLGTILLWGWLSAKAQGGSAIIALSMPPPGGAGYSALQSGAAFSDGAASMYYNPAALSEIERTTGSQLNFTWSDQDLLPILRLPNLSQNFWGIAGVLADHKAGTDLGIGFFRNKINFGYSQNYDTHGEPVGSPFETGEIVYALGLGIRLGAPIAIGGAVKFIDSRLAGPNSYGVKSWAFDLGILIDPKIHPFKSIGISSIDFVPALGLNCQNLGPRVFYTDPHQGDPIPTSYVGAVGITWHFADILEFQASRDMSHEITSRTEFGEPGIKKTGFSFSFLGYRYSQGWLDDPAGLRQERIIAKALDINVLGLYRLVNRIQTGDFFSSAETMENGFPFKKIEVLGIPFRANPHITIGRNRILARDGSRQGQESLFINIGL